jgi:tRNA(Ile)-lysidine synthase
MGKAAVDRLMREVQRLMASRAGSGVVAVSGGADSVALLRALHSLNRQLTVAHLNHQLRGADSEADAAFVGELCRSLDVPFRVKALDVAAMATGDNLEATARSLRYAFFIQVADETGADWIATGHTADDQAETVLHRIIRGTGIQGLRGIAPARAGEGSPQTRRAFAEKWPAAIKEKWPIANKELSPLDRLIRPFLSVTRAEILTYLSALNQPFREDVTNADPRFTRNRIRHELMPLLKSFNPDVVSALAHLAEQASDAHEVIEAVAAEVLVKAERPRAGRVVILDVDSLGNSRAVIRAVLRRLWMREGWPMSEMGFDAWDRAVAVACGELSSCDFPGGVSMRHAARVVQIGPRQ